MVNKEKLQLISRLQVAGIILLIAGVIPLIFGFARGAFAFPELIANYNLYAPFAALSLVGILIFSTTEFLITEGDKRYGNSVGFHTPGEFPGAEVPFFKKTLQMSLLFIIVFSIFGLIFAVTQQQSFTGIGSLPQQFTATDSLIFSSTLVPAAENLGLGFVLAFVYISLRFFARRGNWKKINFRIALFAVGVPVSGTYGLLNHILRYSASEILLLKVFIYWAVTGLLTIITGSFLYGWILHITNNLFFELGGSFASDLIVSRVIIILIALSILLGFLVFRKKK